MPFRGTIYATSPRSRRVQLGKKQKIAEKWIGCGGRFVVRMGMLRFQEHSIPWLRGSQPSRLAGDVDGELQFDGRRLVVDGAGTEVEVADGLDNASVNKRADRLDDLDVHRLPR